MAFCRYCKKEMADNIAYCNACGCPVPVPAISSQSIKFAFLCQLKFSELIGDDQIKKHCPTCRQDVINLDKFTTEEQDKFFKLLPMLANVCVSITLSADLENDTPGACRQRPAPSLGGLVTQYPPALVGLPLGRVALKNLESISLLDELVEQVRKRINSGLASDSSK